MNILNFDETQLKNFFQTYTTELEPKPNYIKRVIMAFIVGGIFCVLGEFLFKLYESFGFEEMQVRSLGAITMIFIGAFLTGIGVYDRIANIAGAGSIVPITGFANAMSSPAIEFKKEGHVFGIGCRIFGIAGPVILFGIFTSWVLGFI